MFKKRIVAAVSLLLLGGLTAGAALADGASRDGGTAGAPTRITDTAAALGVEDGFVDVGESVSPFADALPAIANLEPKLRAALQDAARAAMADEFEFVVTSGWRSSAYQQFLLDAAVIEYGSVEVAGEFVLSPEESKHVTGEAVDIGRTDATSWLSQHGADYGLCQTFANEMWHFELSTSPGGECPSQLPNAHG